MFPSEAETRYTSQRHLNGGVAPSRHALARHAYVEHRKTLAKQNRAMPIRAVFRGVLSRAVALMAALVG